ncbi:hypothetical protein C0989_011742 [Termitomyces sp. Mn162]|nr:hypothetical protein C0989_011742 [Termitomyces sp. Mn162]
MPRNSTGELPPPPPNLGSPPCDAPPRPDKPWVSGSADLRGSAALGESLLGGHDPLALVTKHSKMFRALMACADSQWDVIWTDPGRSREVGLRGNGMVLAGFRQKTVWEVKE